MSIRWTDERPAVARLNRARNSPRAARWWLLALALVGMFAVGAWFGAWNHPANRCQEDEVWDTLRARCTHVEGNVLDDPQGVTTTLGR